MNVKSVFRSKTIYGAAIGFIYDCTYTLESAIASGGVEAADIFHILRVGLIYLGILYGRVSAKTVLYSPKGVPGFNKEDAERVATDFSPK